MKRKKNAKTNTKAHRAPRRRRVVEKAGTGQRLRRKAVRASKDASYLDKARRIADTGMEGLNSVATVASVVSDVYNMRFAEVGATLYRIFF